MVEFIEQAKSKLQNQGFKITAARENVLQILALEKKALSAYQIKDLLESQAKEYKVITIYRVLDLLSQLDLVHKIHSINSFVKCNSGHKHHHKFLVCKECHEIEKQEAVKSIKLGNFRAIEEITEVLGVCGNCETSSKEPVYDNC